MKRITLHQIARSFVLVVSGGITYGVFRMIKWAYSVNSGDLDFIQLLQFTFVCFAGMTVVQSVMVIRSFKYPNN